MPVRMEQCGSEVEIERTASSLDAGLFSPHGKMGLGVWFFWMWALVSLCVAQRVAAQNPPANDVFRRPELLSGVEGGISGINSNATSQAGEPQHGGVGVGKSVWYRWIAPSTSHAIFATTNTTFNTVLAVYTGQAVNSLKEVASNDHFGGGDALDSRVEMDVKEGVEYRLAVDGHGENTSEGSFGLVWNTVPLNDMFDRAQLLSGFAGTVRNDNHGGTADPGELEHAGFEPSATVWFAWPSIETSEVTFSTEGSTFDTVLAVYTGESLNDLTWVMDSDDVGLDGTSSVTWLAEAGVRYRIVVGGKGTTGRYALHWRQNLIPPNNDLFSQALPIAGFAGQYTGTSAGATLEDGEPSPHPLAGGSSVWFSWVAPRDGEMRFTTADSGFDTQLAVFTGETLSSLQTVGANDDTESGLESVVEFNATSNTTYWIRLDGKGGAGDIYWLRWVYENLVSSNNMFAQAAELKGLNGDVLGENVSADSEAGEPFHAKDPGGRSIWYRWVAPISLRMALNTHGSNFDTLLAVYTGLNPVAGLTEVESNDDADVGVLQSDLSFDAVAGQTYWIAVDGSSERGAKPAAVGEVHLHYGPALTTVLYAIPSQGRSGDLIQLYGEGLTDVVSVQFGNVEAQFTVNADGVSVVVPEQSFSAPITVVTGSGDLRGTLDDFVILPNTRPLLSIRWMEGGGLRLAWPSLLPGFKVQRRLTWGEEGVWETLLGPIIQVGGEYVYDLSAEGERAFYRLTEP